MDQITKQKIIENKSKIESGNIFNYHTQIEIVIDLISDCMLWSKENNIYDDPDIIDISEWAEHYYQNIMKK